ncbi:MAG TPA: hypothetical protein DDZ80_03365 [Cyanobacteria bacterium UBA8803]|nr:hypothetical protein [Cyanobacteria bacterium UBA9273]HBL57611.1 hypothetical protein [Cyanobacteria bacterium UBA8803]
MTNIKYFESQVFSESEKISYSEALNRSWYVACHYSDNIPDFAEVIGHGKVDRVVYYNRQWKDEALLKKHLSQYKNCPFEVVTPAKEIDGKSVREIYYCNSAGELQAITEEYLNFSGDILMEVRMDSNRNLYETIEYEYDASGELSIVRECAPDGTVILEDEYND